LYADASFQHLDEDPAFFLDDGNPQRDLRGFNTQEIEEGLIAVLCEFIFCKWGMPVDLFSTWKIELSSDERIKKIRLFVDELLNPLLTSLYPRALWNACHGLLPYHSHGG